MARACTRFVDRRECLSKAMVAPWMARLSEELLYVCIIVVILVVQLHVILLPAFIQNCFRHRWCERRRDVRLSFSVDIAVQLACGQCYVTNASEMRCMSVDYGSRVSTGLLVSAHDEFGGIVSLFS